MPVIERLKERVRHLKSETYALYLAARHPRTPWYAKLFVAGVVAYALSPIDLIPDFVPVLGWLDDLILVPLGIAVAVRMIPRDVLAECRMRAQAAEAGGKPVSRVAAAVIVAIWIVLAALCALWAYEARAQGYPSKPVRMLVGFPPGGGTDILARIVAQKLSEAWSQQVIVDNRPGASATIAANAVAKAAADGYTLSMGQLTPNAIAPALFPRLPYDAAKDFAPIVLVGTSPNVLVVHPGLPAKDVAELVALAKSRPGKLTYASSGLGSLQHIAAELFKSVAGVDIVHVPFKGSGQAVIDLVSGQVDMNFDSIPAVIQHVKSGRLRALAVTAAKRASGLPEVPAVAESGFTDYDLTTWWGLFAPAGTSADAVARVHKDTLAALRNAEVKERFAGLSVDPGGGTPQEFADYVRREIAKYDRIVKQLDIKAE